MTTSVNVLGWPISSTIAEAKAYFGDKVDFYVDGGTITACGLFGLDGRVRQGRRRRAHGGPVHALRPLQRAAGGSGRKDIAGAEYRQGRDDRKVDDVDHQVGTTVGSGADRKSHV